MRAVIVTGRVLAALLLCWAGITFAWTVKELFFSEPSFFPATHEPPLTREVYEHHFAIPLICAGLGIGLLLLASILANFGVARSDSQATSVCRRAGLLSN